MAEVVALFDRMPAPWWIAGGWAIDLFVGSPTRPHHDIDVGIFHRDQLVAQETLGGWDLHAADPPGGLRKWQTGEVLRPAIHDIWCRRSPTAPWSLQLMLNDAEGDSWAFRRDHRITMPLARLIHRTADGTPYLAPEVQLLFKSRVGRREKDAADFEAVLPRLDEDGRNWLAE
ncbi:MAG TPA: amino acid transporter, partial [Chloroflexota bacterium]|nr:amino acid transporter [Chloroflexota bacterium]